MFFTCKVDGERFLVNSNNVLVIFQKSDNSGYTIKLVGGELVNVDKVLGGNSLEITSHNTLLRMINSIGKK